MNNISSYPNMDHPMVLEALNFMIDAHRNHALSPDPVLGGQRRKYSKAHYEVHPIQVAKMVSRSIHNDVITIITALLHDVVEDTHKTLGDIRAHFGKIWGNDIAMQIVQGVSEVTDISKPEDGNRKVRKALDRDHAGRATPERQTVKLADIKSNLPSIVKNDPGFAKRWIAEKEEVIPLLTLGDPKLMRDVTEMIRKYKIRQDCQEPEWELV